MMGWIPWASIPVFFFILWIYTAYLTASYPTLRGKRICLLIAHPDDEAMFFSPTVLALAQPELGNHIKILCLSTGNADGLGDVRRKELAKSGVLLGLKSEEDVLVIDDQNFPDSMTVTWNPKLISNLLVATFAPNMSKVPASKPPQATIDVLITFDSYGVSGHPNHKSLYHGAQSFIKALMHRHSGWECPIRLYSLTSTNIVRKYISIFDSTTTIFSTAGAKKDRGDYPSPLMYMNTPSNYRVAQKAMTTAHQSQMVWFRWGWISIGRYMVMNDLRKVKVVH